MPVVGKEDPSGKQKAMLAATCVDNPREDVKVVVVQRIPSPKQIAGDEEISIGQHQTPQSRHAARLQAAELQNNSALQIHFLNRFSKAARASRGLAVEVSRSMVDRTMKSVHLLCASLRGMRSLMG